jgi:hypothetical protein
MTFLRVMYDENRVKKLPRRFPDKETLSFKCLSATSMTKVVTLVVFFE